MKTSTNHQTSKLKETRTLAQLKKEAKERGIVPTGDKRRKDIWVNALTFTFPLIKYNQQQSNKAQITQIILTRDESTIAESGTTLTATSWLEAERILKEWATIVPNNPTRGYKCTIVFEFSDGQSFKLSKFFLMFHHRFGVNLAKKLLAELQYWASQKIPAHMTEEDYKNYCKKFQKPDPVEHKRLLDSWAIPA